MNVDVYRSSFLYLFYLYIDNSCHCNECFMLRRIRNCWFIIIIIIIIIVVNR